MSLMRLLTSGKTLVGLQGAPRRYRMTDPRSMPSFNEGQHFYSKVQRGEVRPGQPEEAAAGTAVGKVELVQMELAGKASNFNLQTSGKAQEVLSSTDQSPEKLQASSVDLQAAYEGTKAAVKMEAVPTYDIQIASTDTKTPSTNIQAPDKAEFSIIKFPALDRIEASNTESLQPRKTESERTDLKAQSAKSMAQGGERKAQSFERIAEAAVGGGESRRPGPARAARGAFFSQWAERLGAFLPMRARPVRAAQTTAPPQQGELALSLDKVKVVRNDLSDCDVEIVAPQKQKGLTGAGQNITQKAKDKGRSSEIPSQRPEKRAREGVEEEEILGSGTAGSVGMWERATKQWFGNPFSSVAAQQAEVLPSAGAD